MRTLIDYLGITVQDIHGIEWQVYSVTWQQVANRHPKLLTMGRTDYEGQSVNITPETFEKKVKSGALTITGEVKQPKRYEIKATMNKPHEFIYHYHLTTSRK